MNIGLARGLSIGGGLLSGEANRRDAERLYEQQRQDALAQQGVTNELAQNQFDLLNRQEANRVATQLRGEKSALEEFTLANLPPNAQMSEDLVNRVFDADSPRRLLMQHHPGQEAIDPLTSTILNANPEYQQQDPMQGWSPNAETGGWSQAEGYQQPPEQQWTSSTPDSPGGVPISPFSGGRQETTPGVEAKAGYFTIDPSFSESMAREQFDFMKETTEAANLINISDAEVRQIEADAKSRGVDVTAELAKLAVRRFSEIEMPTADQNRAYQELIAGDYQASVEHARIMAEREASGNLLASVTGANIPADMSAQQNQQNTLRSIVIQAIMAGRPVEEVLAEIQAASDASDERRNAQ
jgi:hypothetical protein